jgi:mannitol-1-phosphate 5-dehydrogenase
MNRSLEKNWTKSGLTTKNTNNKLEINNNKIVIFGAGKIGRSFLGQLFGCSGYKVVFVDVDRDLVAEINERGSYPVVIKGDTEQEIIVPGVSAILAFDEESVVSEVVSAGIVSVNVGKNALSKVLPVVAKSLIIRYKNHPNSPLDIILAENMLDAAQFVRAGLQPFLSADYPLNELVGLIETSIGKMVPIMPAADMEKDPLMVFAEPYNTLILDKKGFRSPIPKVNGLAPKENIKAWVDRKAFIHNLGHATAAYYGYFLHPGRVYMYEILEDQRVFNFTRGVMLQSADILQKCYPDDFTIGDLVHHTDDLVNRFRNKALKDTVYRVGQDLARKLAVDDRFMGAVHKAVENDMPFDLILRAMSYGFFFRAKDENGISNPGDVEFLNRLAADFDGTALNVLQLHAIDDHSVIEVLKRLYIYNNQ